MKYIKKSTIFVLIAIVLTGCFSTTNFDKPRDPTKVSFSRGRSLQQSQASIKGCMSESRTDSYVCTEGYGQSLAESSQDNFKKLAEFAENSDLDPAYKGAIYLGYGMGLSKNHDLEVLPKLAQKNLDHAIFQIIDGWAFAMVHQKSVESIYKKCLGLKETALSQVCLFGMGKRIFITNTFEKKSKDVMDQKSFKLGYGFASYVTNQNKTFSDPDMDQGIRIAEAFRGSFEGKRETGFEKCISKFPHHVIFCAGAGL